MNQHTHPPDSRFRETANLKDPHAADADPLSVLRVFDRLEVGPVALAPRRLVAPYRLYHDGIAEATELIYAYDAPVFDPADQESRNLADMIAAQAALNYGLFCRQIRFIGTYDATDRSFLRDMAENTSREIYVKKFLEPNPFLIGEAAALAPVRQKKYLKAQLKFIPADGDAPPAGRGGSGRRIETAIASSPAAAKTASSASASSMNWGGRPIRSSSTSPGGTGLRP